MESIMKHHLSEGAVRKLTKPGRYAVGHGAYLQISEWGTKAWVFRYIRNGKARHVGMGSAKYVKLAEAREQAFEYRRLLARGGDPLEQKRGTKREQRLAEARAKSFRDCALEFIAAHEDGWRGNSSRRQWIDSLTRHVFPKLGDIPVADIDVASVLSVLDPIAREIPETAARIRNRIAAVLDWAAARDLRPHENPARRQNLLPKRKKVMAVRHFPAMPYPVLPAFMVELRQRPDMTARALELAILTASRPGECLGMRWGEVDLGAALWTVPGERMKSGRPHRVPLSHRAVELLATLPREGEFVFLGRRTGAKPHPMVLVTLLRRMGHTVTAHGFRASFKTWASERTNYPRELIEAALAHVIGDAAEQAYSRGDMLARRRQLMEAWSEFCSRPAAEAEIVPIRKVEAPA
jgi:integrase